MLQKTMDMLENQEPTENHEFSPKSADVKKPISPRTEHPYRQKTKSPGLPRVSVERKQATVHKTEDRFWLPKSVDQQQIFATLYNDILTKNKGDKVKTMHQIENLRKQGVLQNVL
jgi:hypothetical protein